MSKQIPPLENIYLNKIKRQQLKPPHQQTFSNKILLILINHTHPHAFTFYYY